MDLEVTKMPYLSDSLANLDLLGWLSVHLIAGRVKGCLDIGDLLELGVRLVAGVAEVFDLGHGEFSDSDEAGPGRNFVPE